MGNFLAYNKKLSKKRRKGVRDLCVVFGIILALIFIFRSYIDLTSEAELCNQYPYTELDFSEEHLFEEYQSCFKLLNHYENRVIIYVFEWFYLMYFVWAISYVLHSYAQYSKEKGGKKK